MFDQGYPLLFLSRFVRYPQKAPRNKTISKSLEYARVELSRWKISKLAGASSRSKFNTSKRRRIFLPCNVPSVGSNNFYWEEIKGLKICFNISLFSSEWWKPYSCWTSTKNVSIVFKTTKTIQFSSTKLAELLRKCPKKFVSRADIVCLFVRTTKQIWRPSVFNPKALSRNATWTNVANLSAPFTCTNWFDGFMRLWTLSSSKCASIDLSSPFTIEWSVTVSVLLL